ncbi:hypothetical protein J437_LFUL015282 [Ladona fulva]|uniref:TNase-like domain-containing protein n=1 Tax=Ladona fulva TaxID=123851 RepID=A0A8K0KV29_LADFU|nr:hypothetical protein J437_LFUL015282 [Ladona fulva]
MDMAPKEDLNSIKRYGILENVVRLLEKNSRGVELGLYTLGFVGLGIALRNIRPFLRFRRLCDIPPSFLEKNLSFKGKILRLEPTNDSPIIVMEHYPLVRLIPRKDPLSGLPVKLLSINIGPNGLAWMNHLLVDKDITFTLMKVNSEAVHCLVTRRGIDIGLNLVSLGFASVSPYDLQMDNNEIYKKYYKELLKTENRAEKIGRGMWMGGGSIFYQYWNKLLSKLSRRKRPFNIAWL